MDHPVHYIQYNSNELTDIIQAPRLFFFSIASNNLPTALCLGVSEGNSSDWSMAYQQYQKRRDTPIMEERRAYLFGMACSTDVTFLNL